MPSRDAEPQGASCRTRRVKPGQVPVSRAVLTTAAAVWLGSEEPGQLLLIKSQLWFLSGEPLSKGTDTSSADSPFPPLTPTHLPALPYTSSPAPTGRRPELPGHSAEACEAQRGRGELGGDLEGFSSGPKLRDGAANMRRARGTDTSTGQLVQRQPRGWVQAREARSWRPRRVQLALAPRASAQEQPKAPRA